MSGGTRIRRREVGADRTVSTAALSDSSITARRGDLAMAIPHHRSMYLTTFGLRVTSALLSGGILCALSILDQTFVLPGNATRSWILGAPTSTLAALWSLIDIVVVLIKDRGLTWRRADRRERQRREPGSAFCWGPPAIHVCAHLAIWVVTVVLSAFLWNMVLTETLEASYYNMPVSVGDGIYTYPTYGGEPDLDKLWIVPAMQAPLALIHFVLFVLACVATDDKVRGYSDIIFVPKNQGKGDVVKTLPAALWGMFKPLRLPTAVSVNQYVRFVPAEDGTVRIAREDGQR